MKSLTFFSKGFALANRNLEIYLIGIALALISFLASLLKDSPLGVILQVSSFISAFLTIGYQVSVPLLLTFKRSSKPLGFNNVWSVVWRNTKRMILPAIIIGTLFIVVFFSFLIWFVSMSHSSNSQDIATTIRNFGEQMRNWNPFLIILGTPFVLFTFTPIYFSIENKGFFASMKRSIIFSLKNLNFILFIMLFDAVTYTVITLVRIPIENPLALLILSVITQYSAFVLSASTLLFYQAKNNS